MNWPSDILQFWFQELKPKDWWTKNSAIDTDIRERFFELWEEQQGKTIDAFLDTAEQALAAVILFDQFPRNMFRDHADSFATDHMAVQIADGAVERNFDDQLTDQQKPFLYMPFMHSENMVDQNKSVLLFARLGSNEKFAKNHRDAIEKFGRFPHRNKLLDRAMRPGEQGAVDSGMKW